MWTARLLPIAVFLLPPLLAQGAPHFPVATAMLAQQVADPATLLNPDAVFYPPSSRRKEEEGTVMLRVHISSDGRVSQAVVASSSGYPDLDKAALDAARVFRFNPAKSKSGQAMNSWVTMPLRFVLRENGPAGEAKPSAQQ